jgi:uncharacterized protein (DUF1015 family)
MAEIEPLRALHYDLEQTGGLQPVVSPPYDVIDAAQRQELLARSPYNAVAIDLPQADPSSPASETGEPGTVTSADPYERAAAILEHWRAEQIVVQDSEPAIWLLEQDYTGPDGRARTRQGFLARVRVTDYGAGKVRPHERTHPGPKEDRLKLTRATKANLSPIFALYSDPGTQAWHALEASRPDKPFGEATDADGTVNRLWRVTDPEAIAQAQQATAAAELLIADGHHRYETARVYAQEIDAQQGTDPEHPGPHDYVLTCLVALQDPGLTVFPTHRLVKNLTPEQWQRLDEALASHFEVTTLDSPAELPPATSDKVQFGYIDVRDNLPRRLTLTDPDAVTRALPARSSAYRNLDTAVLEQLILKQALGFTDDQIDHLDGLGYARNDAEPEQLISARSYDAAFLTAPVPVTTIQEVAAAGETMPPKSTYFFPKVPTGLLFNPLSD